MSTTAQRTVIRTSLPLRSRYRATRLYFDYALQTTYFGTWRVPPIVETKLPIYHTVVTDEIHRPDLIAYRVYGDPSMFWVIAYRNGILLPMADLTVGTVLTCTHPDDVTAALSLSSPDMVGTA